MVALIATYESAQRRLRAWQIEAGAFGQAGLWLLGSVLTSAVATVATICSVVEALLFNVPMSQMPVALL